MPTASPRFKRVLLIFSICVNLGVLGFFKYFNFFVDSARVLLEGVGLHRGDAVGIFPATKKSTIVERASSPQKRQSHQP